MYFEIEPKSKKADFFNYDHEYNEVKKALERKEKIIAVTGVRRVGKTSLLNIIYNESKVLKLWIDGRVVTDPKKEVLSAIYEVAEHGKPRIFGKIESLNISAFGLGLDIEVGKESQTEKEKLIAKAGRIFVFIDEAQRMNPKALADVLSYSYDRLTQVSFLISGSEIGLIEEIVSQSDAEHPLYGREITKISLERLDRNRAMDYLLAGFKQVDVVIEKRELELAIDELDGLIGWLTLYGYERGIKGSKEALRKTSETASRIAASELVHFFNSLKNKELYMSILKNANGIRWEELRVNVSKDLGIHLNPNSFNSAVERLIAYSFVEKKDEKYILSDPLLQKAIFLL